MSRIVRYQGAIVRDEHLLLIRHREHETGHSYWLFPGGGIEENESEEEAVRREMQEETNVDVRVDRLLLEEPSRPGGVYKRRKTYLCTILSGSPSPGYEPEVEASEEYGIVEVRWFDLCDEVSWFDAINQGGSTHGQMVRVKEALGY